MDAKPGVELHETGDGYTVFQAGQKIGVVQRYANPLHKQNCYLKLSMDAYDKRLSRDLFRQLMQLIRQPLQVMADSTDAQLASFLLEGGFRCRRKCYEVEGTAADYVGSRFETPLCFAQSGDAVYARCCELMYCYYRELHAAINPLTATYADFCRKLPQHVCYAIQAGTVIHCAFLEENEIAYVCSTAAGDFLRFAEGLIDWLFSRYVSLTY